MTAPTSRFSVAKQAKGINGGKTATVTGGGQKYVDQNLTPDEIKFLKNLNLTNIRSHREEFARIARKSPAGFFGALVSNRNFDKQQKIDLLTGLVNRCGISDLQTFLRSLQAE